MMRVYYKQLGTNAAHRKSVKIKQTNTFTKPTFLTQPLLLYRMKAGQKCHNTGMPTGQTETAVVKISVIAPVAIITELY